eukprot:TRINITY_DN2047_c0_g1::TRINITY_DN2047_c0_g1_i1::g.21768::m.21768 TRINITY_DN2047_c0_g1::TRINITY_DN2047_c0_g1_i1::g.21768  ORF type:complete len:399 (+),score=192.47,sp/B9FU45/NAP1D_ORYSJ/44.05/7e-59,NAP/PF00956.13/5.5e-75,NAP/PF00956.13/1.5e+04,DMAP_binding/PF06464.6/1.5e+04,DMAP_binding/PF06464.6/0.67,DMAP_binding/PF06464.6/1.1e+03 TRINITY_DN2047_c0_g1_i1:99-1199(+)
MAANINIEDSEPEDSNEEGDDGNAAAEAFLALLPPVVKARVDALKKLEDERSELMKEFEKEKIALIKKYEELNRPLYTKRADIVSGTTQPEGVDASQGPEGIPTFWLQAMKHSMIVSETISHKDEAVLQFLKDVQFKTHDDGRSFTISFHFLPNDHFTNSVLTKSYIMADDEDPILEKAEGTEINWNAGKNPTVKVMKKKSKNKKGGSTMKTKEVPCDSFFNFFNPPKLDQIEELGEDDEAELQELMEADYELGALFRDRLIPHAVLYYTGEIVEDEGFDFFGEDGEGEDFDSEDDDDMPAPKGGRGGRGGRFEVVEDDDVDETSAPAPKKGGKKGGNASAAPAGPAGAPGAPGGANGQNPECKQQ